MLITRPVRRASALAIKSAASATLYIAVMDRNVAASGSWRPLSTQHSALSTRSAPSNQHSGRGHELVGVRLGWVSGGVDHVELVSNIGGRGEAICVHHSDLIGTHAWRQDQLRDFAHHPHLVIGR